MKKCPSHQKDCHITKTSAIRAALRFSKRRGTPLRVYWHSACGSYHLSSKERWSRDIQRKEGAA